jgi:hypothetical protein
MERKVVIGTSIYELFVDFCRRERVRDYNNVEIQLSQRDFDYVAGTRAGSPFDGVIVTVQK